MEEKIDLMVESLHGMEQRLENLKGHSAGFPSSRMKQPPGPFKSPPKREYSPGRTDVLVSRLNKWSIFDNIKGVFRGRCEKK